MSQMRHLGMATPRLGSPFFIMPQAVFLIQKKRRNWVQSVAAHVLSTMSETQNSKVGQGSLFGTSQHEATNGHSIPSPTRSTGGKPEYDPRQLVELLYPSFKSVALTTEASHAERAAFLIGADILYCPELGFLHYEPKRGFWLKDDKEATLTSAKLKNLAPIVREESSSLLRCAAILATAGRDSDAHAMSRAANELLDHARQVERQAFLTGAAKFLAADRRAEIEQFAITSTSWKFAFKNVVFDRGDWRPARRDDFLLNTSPVELDRNADSSEWNALLTRIVGDTPGFAETLQDIAAYAVSGASSLRALPWLYGPRGTGKSTFAELLQTVLGEAAATVDTALLQEDSSRERLGASLWNKRAAFVAEAGNKRLDAELLKMLSGGDRLSVRFLYKEPFTASPSHVLMLTANDAPKTNAYDDALKDRVIALPFTHTLSKGEPLTFAGHMRLESARRDPNSSLLRGFVAWLAEGLEHLYQTQEIRRDDTIKAATAQFWSDVDPLTPFWDTIEREALTKGIAKSELRERYEAWCRDEGTRPVNRSQWVEACLSYGLFEGKSGGVRWWKRAPIRDIRDTNDDNLENPLALTQSRERVLENQINCVPCVPIAYGQD